MIDNIEIGQKVNVYNMEGIVKYIFSDLKKIVLYFKETKEEIEFDFDEFGE